MKKELRCLKCNYEWDSDTGNTDCINCGNIWVKWINYEKWQEDYDKKCKGKNENCEKIK